MEEANSIVRFFRRIFGYHNTPTAISDEDFVEQFSRIHINISSSDVQQEMCWDGPGNDHMVEQGIVALVHIYRSQPRPKGGRRAFGSVLFLMPKLQEKSTMFQPDATASQVSWLVQLHEVAAERRESTRKQASNSSFFKEKPSADT